MTDFVPQSRLARWWALRPGILKVTSGCGSCPTRTEYIVAWGGKWRFRIVPKHM